MTAGIIEKQAAALVAVTTGQYLSGLGLIVILTLVAGWWIARNRRSIVVWLKVRPSAPSFLLWLGKILPFISGAFATWNEIWKPGAWSTHPVDCAYAFYVAIVALVGTYAAEYFRERLKDETGALISQLRSDRDRFRRERDRWLHLAAQIRALIDRKIDAFSALAGRPEITPQEYIDAWDRQLQIHTILKGIHEFFHFELKQQRPNAQLRLALYVPDAERTKLDLGYSWNGLRDQCVTEHPERMLLVSHEGIASLIVETFHRPGDHKLTVVPNTDADEAFHFFTPGQRSYLRSMLAFKYQAHVDGTKTALVLSLDCDEPDFFNHQRATEFTAFLVEMLKRFEYEVMNLELTRKIHHKP